MLSCPGAKAVWKILFRSTPARPGHGKNVGPLDSISSQHPKMLYEPAPAVMAQAIEPIHVNVNLAVMSMAFLLPDTSTPGGLAGAER
jgi:hypothetical protein